MTVRLPAGSGRDTISRGMPDGSIRVALVEDKRVIREGLGEILGRSTGIACVGAYASVEQALPGLEHSPCDVLLLDIHLPGMSGVDGVRAVLDRFPRTRILMLTVYEEEEKVFDSIRNGASGYLLKKTPPGQMEMPLWMARSCSATESMCSGNSTQSRNPPCGRVIRVSGGKCSAINSLIRSTCRR